MSKVWKHFVLITKHKWYVFRFCCKAGIIFRGLKHDLSKYSPTEFMESVKYYNGSKSPIDVCKNINGYSKAWLHHKGKNSHHYEYWQDNFDKGGEVLQMPYKDAIELVCDYLAAGKAYMKNNFSYKAEYEWWKNKIKNPIAMHTQTKLFVEIMLYHMAKHGDCNILKRTRSRAVYRLASAIYKAEKENAENEMRQYV